MPESNERVAALETNMGYVMGVLAKREDYQSSVLKQLTVMELKLDQFLDYQKTCDASREAHGKRLSDLEDARKLEVGARKLIRSQAIVASAGLSLLIAVAGLIFGHR
jgi:hypothetical protein